MTSKKPQGRPPKRASVPFQTTELLQAWMNANMRDPDHALRPERYPLILEALLARIARRDQDECHFCLRSIATIANLDVALFVPQERIEHEVSVELAKLERGHPSRETHYRDTLHSQRGALLDFFLQEHFPHDVRDSSVVKKWLANHWMRILELLKIIPCYCQYASLSYEEFCADKFTKEHTRWWSQARTVNLIVALLHNSSPSNLERLLKGSSSPTTAPVT